MKTKIFILMISFMVGFSYAQSNPQKTDGYILKTRFNKGSISVLDFYRQYSSYTDPGKYAYLYKNLPDSLPELCRLIKAQIIHPLTELKKYRKQIPEGRSNEDFKYQTVKSILKGLLSYDSRGLVKDRKPKNRLLLTCRSNAILLSSILKYRGIPVRVRDGFASYIVPGLHVGHAICEVWNTKEKRWMLVDPTMNMVDFSRDKFEFGNDVWKEYLKKGIDPAKYGAMGHFGESIIVGVFNFDVASLLGTEYTYFQYSPLMRQTFSGKKKLSEEQIKLLNRISNLMNSINAENLSKLQGIYDSTPLIQITKKFKSDTKTSTNKPKVKNTSSKKPDIKFVDIPAGTFMMGSPDTGNKKVDRGGGFYDPAWRCRSAYRGGGTPPGNKGTGDSFRIVKDK